MIIGITGTNGSGKGTIVEILKKNGFKHYSVRNFLLKEIKKRKLPAIRESMIEVANDLRSKNGSSYIVEQLYSQAKKNQGNSIIESIRTVGEILALKNKEEFYLFSIDAYPKLRYQRIFERGESTDKIKYNKFRAQEKIESSNEDPNKQNISKCMNLADYKLENNKGIEELELKVMKILREIYPEKILAREEYINWDEYFMGVAILSSKRSKDPSTQVGACIVDENNKIVGVGYNGWPIGCPNNSLPWERNGEYDKTKYAYVVHAEANAILNSTSCLKDCKIYVGLFPCNECTKLIIQSGIKEIVYISDKYAHTESVKASKNMLNLVGIKIRKFNARKKGIKIEF